MIFYIFDKTVDPIYCLEKCVFVVTRCFLYLMGQVLVMNFVVLYNLSSDYTRVFLTPPPPPPRRFEPSCNSRFMLETLFQVSAASRCWRSCSLFLVASFWKTQFAASTSFGAFSVVVTRPWNSITWETCLGHLLFDFFKNKKFKIFLFLFHPGMG